MRISFQVSPRFAVWAANLPSFNLVIANLIFSSEINALIDAHPVSSSFNLVIENLIFSSTGANPIQQNRRICFNLVIENLIFSSLSQCTQTFGDGIVSISSSRILSFQDTGWCRICHCRSGFNLVIENLIFSSFIDAIVQRMDAKNLFQSRHRESYLFKL